MSNLLNKAKDALSGNKTHHDAVTTSSTHHATGHDAHHGHHGTGTTATQTVGPHSSDLANRADPRVDSDLDHRANIHSSAPGYGGSTTGHGTSTTTAGPHNSNLANKADPRVDSDYDHRANPNSSVPGYGSGTSGYGASTTTAGPHSSNFANKIDPRVDSDLDHRAYPNSSAPGYGSSYGASTTTSGTHGTAGYGTSTTTAGPHGSDTLNRLDPRVDSDRDHRNDPTSRVGGYGAQDSYGTGGHHAGAGGLSDNTQGYGTTGATESTRVHDSKLLNRLDPKTVTDKQGRAI